METWDQQTLISHMMVGALLAHNLLKRQVCRARTRLTGRRSDEHSQVALRSLAHEDLSQVLIQRLYRRIINQSPHMNFNLANPI